MSDSGSAVEFGTVTDPRLHEISGMVAASRRGHLWAHNDSGGGARLYLLRAAGTIAAVFELPVRAIDWEDIARGPGPEPGRTYLYIADSGNNSRRRDRFVIYRFPEPDIDEIASRPSGEVSQTIPRDSIAAFSFGFPAEPADAEGLVVHPTSGVGYLFTKDVTRCDVLRLDFGATGNLRTAPRVATFSPGFMVTAADIATDASRVLVRTYLEVLEYAVEGDVESAFARTPRRLASSRAEIQSEAIAITQSGNGYVTTSETVPAPLSFFALEPPAPPASTPERDDSTASDSSDRSEAAAE